MAVANCPSDPGGYFKLFWGSDTKLEHCGLHRRFLPSPCAKALTPPRTLTPAQSLHPGRAVGAHI